MIKLGHLKDINTAHIPSCIINDVKKDLELLDCHYGETRDIDNDTGGFVIICDKSEVLYIPNFKEDILQAEYTENVEEYQKSLYISGAERNIIIYRCLNDGCMLR